MKELILPSLLLLGLTACASSGGHDVQGSGFLGDYTIFDDAVAENGFLIWSAGEGGRTADKKLMVAPVKFYFGDSARPAGLDDDDLHALATVFREEVIAECRGVLPIAEAPGSDVVLLRAVITGIVPVVKPAEVEGGGTAQLGGASMEGEFVDSVSGERLAAILSNQQAAAFHSGLGEFSTASQARQVFRAWAAGLRRAIERRIEEQG